MRARDFRERKKETLGGGDHERKREKIKWSGFIICFQKFSLWIWPNAKLFVYERERERERERGDLKECSINFYLITSLITQNY